MMTDQLKQRVVGGCVVFILLLVILPLMFKHRDRPEVFDKQDGLKGQPAKKADVRKEPSQTILPLPSVSSQVKSGTPQQEPALDSAKEKPHGVKPPKPSSIVLEPEHASLLSVEHRQPEDLLIQSEHALKSKTDTLQTDPYDLAQIEGKILSDSALESDSDFQPSAKSQPILSEPDLGQKKPEFQESVPNTRLKPLEQPQSKRGPKAQAKQRSPLRGPFSVQLGTFSQSVNAHQLAKRLKQKGYSVWVLAQTSANGQKQFRVLVGSKQSKTQALALQKHMANSYHLKGLVVPYRATVHASKTAVKKTDVD